MSKAPCKDPNSERDYEVSVPPDHWELSFMPDFTFEEWIDVFKAEGERGGMRKELADLVVRTLLRLPDLEPGQVAIGSFSGGKDSQAFCMICKMKYGDRFFMLFADTDDEWPESYEFIPLFEEWIGVPIHTVVGQDNGLHNLLRERMTFWPLPSNGRHCTKETKMLPQRDWMDDNGYDQVRHDKRVSSLRDSRGKTKYPVTHPAPLSLVGERWAEGGDRKNLPFDKRDDTMLRMTHRPVLDWTIADIWDFIFWMQAPFNKVYLLGIKRCACAGCIFASPREIELLGKYNPGHLARWVETERRIGHPRSKSGSFAQIQQRLIDKKELGIFETPERRTYNGTFATAACR